MFTSDGVASRWNSTRVQTPPPPRGSSVQVVSISPVVVPAAQQRDRRKNNSNSNSNIERDGIDVDAFKRLSFDAVDAKKKPKWFFVTSTM